MIFGKKREKAVDQRSLSKRILSSLAEILLVFSAILLIMGAITSAAFAGFVGAAILALPAIAFARRAYRIAGGIVLVLAILGAISSKDDLSPSSSYRHRGRLTAAADLGREIGEASLDFKKQKKVWPKSLEDIKFTKTSAYVRNVALEPDGTIRVVLSFSPLEGKALVFTPEVIESGEVSWKCSAPDIPRPYLPSRFRQD